MVARMKHTLLAALLAVACATAPSPAAAQSHRCPPAGYSRSQLEALKTADWAIADDAARNALARALIPCVSSPDPALRDVVLFEALQHWLRARQLSNETMLALADDLEPRLSAPEGQGFERPFAALILSEVARADRIEPYLSAERRARLLDSSIAYLRGVRDYRGFDERVGWRHGVAHGADLMLQLSLNPALGKPELERIRDAVASQLQPEGHFYIYGESARLAGAIVYMAQRGVLSEAEWTAWFAALPMPSDDAYTTQAGLARRHNLTAFLEAVWLNAKLSQSAADDALLPGAETALRALP